MRDNELIRYWLGGGGGGAEITWRGVLRSLWSFAAGAWGAQPQWQPVSAGEGALPQPPTAPAREILLGVTGLSPTSPSPRARERGPQRPPPRP